MTGSILVFSRATPHHHAGGMEEVSWGLAAEWARLGRDVRLVTTAIPGRDGPFSDAGVEVLPLSGTASGRYSRAWWDASRRYWAGLATPPSVVLSVSSAAYAAVRDRYRHPHTPFVMQAHGTSAMEILSKLRVPSVRYAATAPKNALWLVRDLARYRDFDRIVAVGDRVYDSLVAKPQRWSVGGDRIRLIRNGVRAESQAFDPAARERIRAELGIGPEVVAVACVGRLHVQKRMDRALRAAAALGERERYRFLLVGDGPDEQRLRGLANDLGVAEMVHFTGRADRDRVRGYHSAADVALVTTARLEVGLPLVVLEALASGLPCVVPASFVAPGAAGDGLHPVDAGDTAAVAAALTARAAGPGTRASLLPAELTLEHCARAYLDLFGEVAPVGRA
ncbi:glycosyltransferase [Phytohabitans suffuscus]|uniref:Glycosyl transferase family 1 n=1 Tax=Phytohabitans suffuscus TaxID=624315 RepID=A0A6F8YDK6_9ACTN|nr:glycosyltransferase [Phytohabitans suffuscus]BCB84182.1 hypothetical protein Psuf_014950 [Phytohabitans suffuscus]